MAFILLEVTYHDHVLYPAGAPIYRAVLDHALNVPQLQIKKFPSWNKALDFASNSHFSYYGIYETTSLEKLKPLF